MSLKTQRTLDRAKKLAKKGDYNQAEDLFKTLLDDASINSEVKKELLLLDEAKNNSRAPKAELQSIIRLYSNGEIKQTLKAIESLSKKYPNEPILYNIAGACYKQENNLDFAI